jgi:hypothetical protein
MGIAQPAKLPAGKPRHTDWRVNSTHPTSRSSCALGL